MDRAGTVPNAYPAQLILQDALTIHGSQFRNVDLIVASPPCQNYSYLAMPWSRSTDPNNSKAAKALRKKWETEGPDNRLFDACFRIQREACEAAGRYIPMVVENVRGAVPWVGPAKANFGSFYLWGDIAMVGNRIVAGGSQFSQTTITRYRGESNKLPLEISNSIRDGMSPARWTNTAEHYFGGIHGTKIGGDWFSDPNSTCRKHGSRSQARKAASAQIAKIPIELSRYIARAYKPLEVAARPRPSGTYSASPLHPKNVR